MLHFSQSIEPKPDLDPEADLFQLLFSHGGNESNMPNWPPGGNDWQSSTLALNGAPVGDFQGPQWRSPMQLLSVPQRTRECDQAGASQIPCLTFFLRRGEMEEGSPEIYILHASGLNHAISSTKLLIYFARVVTSTYQDGEDLWVGLEFR